MKMYQIFKIDVSPDLDFEHWIKTETPLVILESKEDALKFIDTYGGNLEMREVEFVSHAEFDINNDYGCGRKPYMNKTEFEDFSQRDIDMLKEDTGLNVDEYLRSKEMAVLIGGDNDCYGKEIVYEISKMKNISNIESKYENDYHPSYIGEDGKGSSATILFENGSGFKIDRLFSDYEFGYVYEAYKVAPCYNYGEFIDNDNSRVFHFNEAGLDGENVANCEMMKYLRELVYEKNIEDVASKVEQTDGIQTATKSHETIEPISEQEKYKLIKDIEGDSTILSDFIKDYAVNYVQTSENSAKITFENGVGVYIAGDRFVPYEIKDDKEQPIIVGYFSPRGADGVNGLYGVLRHSEDGRIYNYQNNSDIEFFEKTQMDLETFAGKVKEYSKINEMFSSSAADIVLTVEPFAKDIVYKHNEIGIVMEGDTGKKELLVLSPKGDECTVSRLSRNENGHVEMISSNTTSMSNINSIIELINYEHANFVNKYAGKNFVNIAETPEEINRTKKDEKVDEMEGKQETVIKETVQNIDSDRYQLLNQMDDTGKIIDFVDNFALGYEERNNDIRITFENGSGVYIGENYIIPYIIEDEQEYVTTLRTLKVEDETVESLLGILKTIEEHGAEIATSPIESEVFLDNPITIDDRIRDAEFFNCGERVLGGDIVSLYSFVKENDLETMVAKNNKEMDVILGEDVDNSNKELLHIRVDNGLYTAYHCYNDGHLNRGTMDGPHIINGSREEALEVINEIINDFENSKSYEKDLDSEMLKTNSKVIDDIEEMQICERSSYSEIELDF